MEAGMVFQPAVYECVYIIIEYNKNILFSENT